MHSLIGHSRAAKVHEMELMGFFTVLWNMESERQSSPQHGFVTADRRGDADMTDADTVLDGTAGLIRGYQTRSLSCTDKAPSRRSAMVGTMKKLMPIRPYSTLSAGRAAANQPPLW